MLSGSEGSFSHSSPPGGQGKTLHTGSFVKQPYRPGPCHQESWCLGILLAKPPPSGLREHKRVDRTKPRDPGQTYQETRNKGGEDLLSGNHNTAAKVVGGARNPSRRGQTQRWNPQRQAPFEEARTPTNTWSYRHTQQVSTVPRCRRQGHEGLIGTQEKNEGKRFVSVVSRIL